MNLSAAARSLSLQKDIDSWSKLLAARSDERHLAKVTKLADPTLPTLSKANKLSDPRIRFAYVNADATLGVATTLEVFDGPGDADTEGRFAIGNASDNTTVVAPIRIDLDEFQGSFLALVPKKSVDEHKLLAILDPDHFPESVTYPDCPAGETNNLARLGFGAATTNDDTPRFVVLPKICPIPAGAFLPDYAKFTAELPVVPAGCPPLDKLFTVWFEAVCLLFQRNGGKGLNHQHSTLFEPAEIPVAALPYDPIALSTSLVAKTKAIRYTSLHGNAVRLNFQDAVATELMLWYHNNASDAVRTTAPTGLGAGFTIQELVAASSSAVATAVVKAQLETPDASSRADTKAKEDVKIRYRLLFARNGRESANSDEVLLPAALSSDFQEILGQKADHCTEGLQAAFQLFLGQLANSRGPNLTTLATISKRTLYSVLVKAMLRFQWLSVPLVRDRESIHSQLSLVHFLPVTSTNSEYLDVLAKDATASAELRHETDTTKHGARITKLFTGGAQGSVGDVKAAIYNLLVLGRFMAPEEFDRSALHIALSDYLLVLSGEDGKDWVREFDSHQVAHNVLMDATTITSYFVAVASDISNRRDLMGDQPISASKLANAVHLSEMITNKLRLAVSSATANTYSLEPPTLALFRTQAKRPTSEGDSTPNKQQRTAQTDKSSEKSSEKRGKKKEEATKKKTPSTPEEIARRDSSRTRGFLLVEGNKAAPVCQHLFPLKPGAEEKGRLCMGEAILGRGCPRDPCPYAHVPDPKRLVVADKQALVAYVEASEGLSFVQGKRPTTPAVTIPLPPSLYRPPSPYRSNIREPNAAEFLNVEQQRQTSHPALAHTPSSDQTDEARGVELFPIDSPIVGSPTGREQRGLTKRMRLALHASLPTAVQAQLNQPFGKDNKKISFTGAATLFHSIPLIRSSGFLSRRDWSRLTKAFYAIREFNTLMSNHRNIDFRPHIGFSQYKRHSVDTGISQEVVAMCSAALLHYNGDVATVVRVFGGPHVGAQRNVPAILHRLRNSVKPATLVDLERIYTTGCPSQVNAHSSTEQFNQFYLYGNHRSASEVPMETLKTLIKDARRGSVLIADIRLIPFIRHLHLTPQGIVNIGEPWKSIRPVFDSSFRPSRASMALNDWTDPANEPTLEFPGSFRELCTWIWNLRISYPHEPILLGDNDISGAFRLAKYHPNMVAPHAYTVLGKYLVFNTGLSFGDNTSPANFEPIAIARKEHARYLWQHESNTVLTRAHKYVEQMNIVTTSVDSAIQQANKDRFNPGVFDAAGLRLPPPYPHQVDDCLFADIPALIHRTSAASIVALEDVCDVDHPDLPPVLSHEKLNLAYAEERTIVGLAVNTRDMTVGLTTIKRQRLIDVINVRLSAKSSTIREIATLHGLLVSASEYCQWGKAQFFLIQNMLRTIIRERYYKAKHWLERSNKRQRIHDDLPQELRKRTESLIATEIAAFVWRNKVQFTLNRNLCKSLEAVRDYLINPSNPWKRPIAHLVPREPTVLGTTDASAFALAGHLPVIETFFIVPLDRATHERTQLLPADPNYLHINQLEFASVILAFVATQMRLDSLGTDTNERQHLFPLGIPPAPLIHVLCDNTAAVSWCNRMATKSDGGQQLLRVFAELLLAFPTLGLASSHIPAIPERAQARILDGFPPESRTLVAPRLRGILTLQFRSARTAKELGTDRSRQEHFLWFCQQLKLSTVILHLDGAEPAPTETLNYTLAIYAAHLGTGATLSCRSIKTATIKHYINAAARLISVFDPKERDPRLPTGQTKIASAISKVYNELERWESIPDRREPYTLQMQQHLATLVHTEPSTDSLHPVLYNWFGVGLQTGCRLSEWAQERGRSSPHQAQRDIFGDVRAFHLRDLQFYGPNKQHLTTATALLHPEQVVSLDITFRTQKNGNNGERRLFTRNTRNSSLDVVAHWIDIASRFVRLVGWNDATTPLSVYQQPGSTTIRIVTATEIETTMRHLASVVYDLNPNSQRSKLKLWSAHSLRVGACVILHGMNFTESQIKHLLRWRSDAFMMYLRNLHQLSSAQNEAVTDAANIPNFY